MIYFTTIMNAPILIGKKFDGNIENNIRSCWAKTVELQFVVNNTVIYIIGLWWNICSMIVLDMDSVNM